MHEVPKKCFKRCAKLVIALTILSLWNPESQSW
jgi:hypothetical protein